MVKCADCGFLTMRNRYTGELDEMERDFRESGDPATRKRLPTTEATTRSLSWSDTIYPYVNVPLCFMAARDEYEDFAAKPSDVGYEDFPSSMVLEILQKERDCTEFTKWNRGFTPKEHREMLDRQWKLDYEATLRKEIYDREDARDERMEKREDARDDAAKEFQGGIHRRELWILGGAVIAAGVIGSVAAAIIEGAVSRGWEPSWWPL